MPETVLWKAGGAAMQVTVDRFPVNCDHILDRIYDEKKAQRRVYAALSARGISEGSEEVEMYQLALLKKAVLEIYDCKSELPRVEHLNAALEVVISRRHGRQVRFGLPRI